MLNDGVDIRSIIARYWKINHEDWDRMCYVEPAKARQIPESEPDTEQWLLDTMPKPLAKVLANRIMADGMDSAQNFSDELHRLMTIELKRILNDAGYSEYE
jgi:hypothetical protein